MKKLFLFCAAVSLSLGVSAQEATHQSVLFGLNNTAGIVSESTPAPMAHPLAPAVVPSLNTMRNPHVAPLERTTGMGGSKWYSYFNTIDALTGNLFSGSTPQLTWGPLWWDSTVTRRYSNGVFANPNAAACIEIDPSHYTEYNDLLISSLVSSTDIKVTPANPYHVDSIAIRAAYIRNAGRPAGIMDTLVVSVAPQRYNVWYNQSWIHNNPNVTDTALHVFMPYFADSLHRAAFPDSVGLARSLDTFIIDPATLGHFPDLSSGTGESDTLQTYIFPINGSAGLDIPAGFYVSATIAFKSGDTWSPNRDSVNNFNRFCPVWGFEGSGAIGWMSYWYGNNPSYMDHNGSSKMDSRTLPMPDFWLASIAEQANSGAANFVAQQYLDMDVHVVCSTCYPLGVGNVSKVFSDVKAYPNPATTQVNIPFTLTHTANVTVQITNTLGQVLNTQSFSNVKSDKATFNTASFPSGMYFYTINADGTNFTGRFVVAH